MELHHKRSARATRVIDLALLYICYRFVAMVLRRQSNHQGCLRTLLEFWYQQAIATTRQAIHDIHAIGGLIKEWEEI